MQSFDETGATTVYTSRRRKDCAERALVLQALDISHHLTEQSGICLLSVAEEDAERAVAELERYATENRGWTPARKSDFTSRGSGVPGVAVYVFVLLVIAWIQTRTAFGPRWYAAGKVDVALIGAGEWWRTVTALTLHLDLPHLVGNLCFGALFGLVAGQFAGSGAAWLAIVLAGAAGNALNALVQPDAHTAVGASTAVFGALGIASSFLWQQRRASGERWAYRWAPVVAGGVLLTWFGTGGERTDIVAHLTGFSAGAGLGWVLAALDEGHTRGAARQLALGLAAAALLALAWTSALATAA